jgi:predicted esterase
MSPGSCDARLRHAALAFAPGLTLDLWLPAGVPRTVVLALHGGGFGRGREGWALPGRMAGRLLPLGHAVASADYRLATPAAALPSARARAVRRDARRSAAALPGLAPRLSGAAFAAALADAAAAVGALQDGRADAATAARPVMVLGVSAGGILALSLVWPPRWLQAAPRPAAAWALAAAMVQPWRLAPGTPPAMLLHATADRIVPPATALRAQRAAAAAGAPLTVACSGRRGHNAQTEAFLDAADPAGRPWFDRFLADLDRLAAAPDDA